MQFKIHFIGFLWTLLLCIISLSWANDNNRFFIPWFHPRYTCLRNCGKDVQERSYCCYTIKVDKCCFGGSFHPTDSNSNGDYLGSFHPPNSNVESNNDFLGSFYPTNSKIINQQRTLLTPSESIIDTQLPNGINPLIYIFPQSTESVPNYVNLPSTHDPSLNTQQENRILVPPGSSINPGGGNTKILIPPGYEPRFPNNGNTKILIPPGYESRFPNNGNTKILIPPGYESLFPNYGNTKILIPPGTSIDSNENHKILLPPGYQSGFRKTGRFSGAFIIDSPENKNILLPPQTNIQVQNETKQVYQTINPLPPSDKQPASRILIPEGWNKPVRNGTKILTSGSSVTPLPESEVHQDISRKRKTRSILRNFFLPGILNDQVPSSYGGSGSFGGESSSFGGSGSFGGESSSYGGSGSFGGSSSGNLGGSGLFNPNPSRDPITFPRKNST